MKKLHLVILVLLTVLTVRAERLGKVTLNDHWAFQMKGGQTWQMVNLPHTWNTDSYETKDYLQGEGHYRRALQLPDSLQGKRLFLKVDAASKTLSLTFNGHTFPTHVGGYSAATYDITELVRWDGGENQVEMAVDNATQEVAPTSADFTFQGGVYRDVWLLWTNPQHFSLTDRGAEAVYIATPSVTDQRGEISVRATVCNDEGKPAALTLRAQLISPEGEVKQTLQRRLKVASGATATVADLAFVVENPALWSPESPTLYRIVTSLLDKKGQVVDESWHYTGLRYYAFDAERGFMLNGHPYKLRGLCRHQDQKPYGVALSDEQHRRDFRLMKEMGANFLRIAHYPQDDALLEMCDREGLLAWEEIPIVNVVPDGEAFADNCESMLRDMIRQHYNHPSIILWGYMNEILLRMPRQKDGKMQQPVVDRTLALAHRLEKVLHEEDPHRLSTMAFHATNDYNSVGLGEITDVVGWNLYQGWYGGPVTGFERYLADQHKNHPSRAMIISEYGAGGDRRLHSFAPLCFDFSIEYQQFFCEHYMQVIEETPYVMGGTYWNLIDFSSASREESMPHINNKGLLYASREPKDVYYYFQAMWTKTRPVLHIATRDWPQRVRMADEATQPVKVYGNCPRVELFLDGKSLGVKEVKGCVALFDVPFHQGQNVLTAKADGVEDAHRVWTDIVPTDLRQAGNFTLAVNVGSNCYFTSDASQLTWVPDRPYKVGSWGYVGGKASTSTSEVAQTPDVPLYQSMRQGFEAYRFDVPDGDYEVELFFSQQVGQGEKSAYLLGKAADAKLRAVRQRLHQRASSGQGLTIRVDEVGGNRSLAGIVVRKL